MKIHNLGCIGFALTSFLALVFSTGCHSGDHHEKTSAVFQVLQPSRMDTDITREYVCQIRAIQHIELKALERGYLQEIFVDEGQAVEKGQPMFQLLPTLFQAELQKAQAEAEFARIEYQNTKTLADKNIVSPNELALAKARLDKASAELSLAKVHRDFTQIKAPFDGIMDRLLVRQGSLIEEGEHLTTLSDNSQLWVYFNVTEAEYLDYKSQLDAGAEMKVKLLLANNQLFDQTGKVDAVQAEFNNETGTIAFRATFPNPNRLLRHGETGKVLLSRTLQDALVIPQAATFEVLDKKYVYVVDKENVVRSRQIAVAEELPHLYVVGSGLSEKDAILFEGLRKVKDGDKIATKLMNPKEVIAHLDVPAE